MDMTHFDNLTHPDNYRQIPVRTVDKWILGVDLGQTTDPTAICVLRHMITPVSGAEWKRDDKAKTWRQPSSERFRVYHLERLKLGTPYPLQVQHVAALLRRAPLDAGCTLIIDETGVGRAVGDIFNAAGLRPKRVTITAGLETTQHGGDAWHVPKGVLISTLDARLQLEEFQIADTILDSLALRDELKNFHRHVGEAGRATWSARTGTHDDLVLSCAISLWFATSGPTSSVQPFPF